jgi:hypothetical protein
MASINKFRSLNVLNKSHKLHGLTLCLITVFNMIYERRPHLCTPHIQLSVRSLRRAVNFNNRINHKDQGGFPMPRKEGHLSVDGLKCNKKQTVNSLWAWGSYYTLDGVSIHPAITKTQVSDSLPGEEVNRSGISPWGQQSLMTMIRENNIVVTPQNKSKEGTLYRIQIFQNTHPVCNKALK